MAIKIIATNKKAYHNFHLAQNWEVGIALNGAEVKSVREGGVSFADSFARIEKREAFLYNLHIAPYREASYLNLPPDRPRKLLLHKREIDKIAGMVVAKGVTLIPTKMYFSARGFVKVELALGKGKKLYDKREDMKNRDIDRDLRRALSHHRK